jgi:15-cis-phytoene synthase
MTRSTSFYFSFLALPGPKRRAITAVFDFCRVVDDSVDLETDPARIDAALALWRGEVARVFTGDRPTTEQGRQLQPFVVPHHLPRQHFDALVDGVAMDAAGTHYRTFADLEPYCHRVASAVGLICAEIFEYREAAVLDYARDLGVALQLTNILRDVGVDFRNGRRYVPDEDFLQFGCSWDDIENEVQHAGQGVRSDAVRALLAFQGARAREFFAKAAAALPSQDARRFVPAEIMRAVYWGLLMRIERANYDVFTQVIRVPRPAQARVAIGAWWRVR